MDTSTMDAMPDGMADATPDGMMDAMPDGSGDGGDGGVGDGGDAGDAGDAGYDPVARGDYLVNHVWTCGDCHSPRGADFMFIPGMRLSGNSGLVPDLHIPNITPHMTTGIGAWTD
ncbi:MAG: hypothetical protein GWN73_20605, partial [Actinobacteria bacterium]|nr:hypothetical protein [Actinomycetota bacterium]NIU67696.1 hypothetical protein [Actinomycetota bacterium]NIW29468.1 hypothetical protein [Actinomycetota bacterium]